jgi:exodeoxyribonuclease VII large subunit
VIVLIRGGGALEDLWAFNEDNVAEAVFQSRIPVLAGIGHEVDVTLADMTADARAATPSHAAQLLWPPREELAQCLDDACTALQRAMTRRIADVEGLLREQAKTLHWFSPARRFARLNEKLRRMFFVLEKFLPRKIADEQKLLAQEQKILRAHIARLLERHEHAVNRLTLSLQNANPAAPLKKGYALVSTADGEILSSVTRVFFGQKIRVRLEDGYLSAVVGDVDIVTDGV